MQLEIDKTNPISRTDSRSSIARIKFKLLLGLLLVAASAVAIVLEKVQTRFSGADNYAFLVFNLKLAWIPFAAAVAAYVSRHNRALFAVALPVCTLVWLAFFPNAPYLLTDFQHLAFNGGGSPLWFDVILMIWFAWTGLLLGVTSLYLMQELVTRTFSPAGGWIFAVSATILSSIGVYLGRFLRWNSWDLVKDPLPIARDMAAIVRHPIANLPGYIFTILFTLLFLFIYLTVYLLGRAIRIREDE